MVPRNNRSPGNVQSALVPIANGDFAPDLTRGVPVAVATGIFAIQHEMVLVTTIVEFRL
jgi:hypothetical protein